MISAELICKSLDTKGAADGKTVSIKYNVVEGTSPTNTVYQCVFALCSKTGATESSVAFNISVGDAVAFWEGFDSLTSTNQPGAIETKPAKKTASKRKK